MLVWCQLGTVHSMGPLQVMGSPKECEGCGGWGNVEPGLGTQSVSALCGPGSHSWGRGTQWEGTRWEGTRWVGLRWEGTRWVGSRWVGTGPPLSSRTVRVQEEKSCVVLRGKAVDTSAGGLCICCQLLLPTQLG